MVSKLFFLKNILFGESDYEKGVLPTSFRRRKSRN